MRDKFILKLNQKCVIKECLNQLDLFCYERVHTLSSPGEFTLEGGNLSVFPVNERDPIRFEFFGDIIDNIFSFNLENGKKIERLRSSLIKPNFLTLDDKSKITPGKYVVHEDHGIGLFSRFEVKKAGNQFEEYIVISYLNEDKLYVPVNLKIKISSYIGVGHKKPRLNRLGSPVWKKTFKKTYENILRLAKELLKIYAEREITKRKPWKIDGNWNIEVVRTFGYEETEDQIKAINETFTDLKKDIPMDRLICGDVGFGKTEVAIRAAVQAVVNGCQVAILVPTTILAEQHFVTISDRLKNLPINIAKLSRFSSTKEEADAKNGIKDGSADIIIGTHKLFSENLAFKNLGLLVIDEEQKFGVKDKEKLKKLKINLNILSLTATPIPRTLFMSLSGIRDLSQISNPPVGRKEILTQITKYNNGTVGLYVNREINRGGQVYYLHNEVETIGATRNRLQKQFPGQRIEVAHGQMGEKALAQTMKIFSEGKIDILVCSTIIENGLDLPNVNTLIVEDADKFGLSQLYQIRGRIGRSKKQSYALFTHKDKAITPNAHKRLKALAENTELGTGYNIALSDLEIRGGGNILGREQHGNMEAIGLVLYTKMLNLAVKRLKEKQTKNFFNHTY